MKLVYGWWFPDWDLHHEEHFSIVARTINERPCPYQQNQRNFALSFVKNFGKVVDVGGNVGTWSKPFSEKFSEVYAFEPHPDNRECYKKNLEDITNVTLYPYALGEAEGTFPLYIHDTSCGNVSLNLNGVLQGPTFGKPNMNNIKTIDVEVRTLDSFNFTDIDFIKIDVQGDEFNILKGAVELLKNQAPVLVLELPTRSKEEVEEKNKITNWLSQFNYILRGNVIKETVYTK